MGEVHSAVALKSSVVVPKRISLRYVFCSQLFSQDVMEKMIPDLDPGSIAIKDLIGLIGSANTEGAAAVGTEGDVLTLELYTHEGYPLGVNEYTEKCKCVCMLSHVHSIPIALLAV